MIKQEPKFIKTAGRRKECIKYLNRNHDTHERVCQEAKEMGFDLEEQNVLNFIKYNLDDLVKLDETGVGFEDRGRLKDYALGGKTGQAPDSWELTPKCKQIMAEVKA